MTPSPFQSDKIEWDSSQITYTRGEDLTSRVIILFVEDQETTGHKKSLKHRLKLFVLKAGLEPARALLPTGF